MGEEVRGTPDVSASSVALSVLIIAIFRKQKRSTASRKQSSTSSLPTWRASKRGRSPTIDILLTSLHLIRYNHTAFLAFDVGLISGLPTVSSISSTIQIAWTFGICQFITIRTLGHDATNRWYATTIFPPNIYGYTNESRCALKLSCHR